MSQQPEHEAFIELNNEELEQVTGGKYGQNRAMFKNAMLWTLGSTAAEYGVGLLGSVLSRGQSQQQQQQQNQQS